jgi:hypothetical protein
LTASIFAQKLRTFAHYALQNRLHFFSDNPVFGFLPGAGGTVAFSPMAVTKILIVVILPIKQ